MLSREGIPESVETVIIGAGQAGLATGYFLQKKRKPFIILDKCEKIGDSWRRRWDSLHLFTPFKYDSLPGLRFPEIRSGFPSKDEMSSYLESYATKFSLPVHCAITVNKRRANDGHFEIITSEGFVTARNVVIATGTNPVPRIPDFARDIASDILQLHSSEYINAAGIPPGEVLVIGAGTSGMEIALELAATHRIWLAGRPTFHIPDPVFRYAGGFYWWIVTNLLNISTPLGRKARQQILKGGAPLIRISVKDVESAGVKMVERITGVTSGLPQVNGRSITGIAAIIWATGYKPDFSWVDPDITDVNGWPSGKRGVSDRIKGLFYVGMPFQYGLTSGLVGGVGRDAEYISQFL